MSHIDEARVEQIKLMAHNKHSQSSIQAGMLDLHNGDIRLTKNTKIKAISLRLNILEIIFSVSNNFRMPEEISLLLNILEIIFSLSNKFRIQKI